LLHGIHLPNLVGLLRLWPDRLGFAARRRRRQIMAAEPTLQRANTGQGEIRTRTLQLVHDKISAPRRMLSMQQQRLF
jgi:hypothetical protein